MTRTMRSASTQRKGLLAAVGMTAALSIAVTGPLASQSNEWTPSKAPWKDSFYPYLPSLGNNFPLIALHFEERKAADYFARTPYAGLLSIDAGLGFTGARMLIARFRAPLLIEHWRFAAALAATRETRLAYYGLGNDTKVDDALVTESQPHYYQAQRSRYLGHLEISRHIVGPVFLSGAGTIERSNLSDLDGPSLFRTDYGTEDLTDTDVRGRASLVVDARDNEFNTTQGLFAQASLVAGSGGGNYTRASADVRGYLRIRDGTVLAARVAGSSLTSDASLNARWEIPEWEYEVNVLGGANSHRGLRYQRFTGRGVLFANTELRHDLLNLGDLGAIALIGFFDAGRVFETEDFKLTTKDMKLGGGGGIELRLMRFAIWTFNFAGGPDGFQFTTGSGWAF